MKKKLLGWVLYKKTTNQFKEEDYEIQRLLEEAEKLAIQLLVLNPDQLDIIVTKEDRKSILVDEVPTELPDFIIPRMGSGTTYFALAVIRHLERLGVYSVNGSVSIDTVKDKLFTLQILAQSGLPIPKTILVKFPFQTSIAEDQFSFPIIVKTLSGSQGSGVFLSTDKNSFSDLMQLIQVTNPSANIILQEFIHPSHGRDLRVLTVGGRVISAMQRIAAHGNFKANFSLGGTVEKFELSNELEWLVLEITRILQLDVAGIDLLFDENGFKICEVNSSPGFEGMELACSNNVAAEILKFVQVRLSRFSDSGSLYSSLSEH